MKYLLALLITLTLFACNGKVPCETEKALYPECESTNGVWVEAEPCICDCGSEHTFVLGEGCVEDPPPTTTTTVTERQPEDYITLGRGERIIYDVDVESRSGIWLSIWSGVRDEEYVARYCPDIAEEVLNMSAEELVAMAAHGRVLIRQWENKWRNNLSTINWRCETDERYCPPDNPDLWRSNVLKKNWDPYLAELRLHRARAGLNRALAQEDPQAAHCSFDSIAGWCLCRNR